MNETLPYRSDPDDIRRYLVSLARGGGESRIAALALSRKNHEGVVAAILALGLAEGRQGPLTDKGRRIALEESAAGNTAAWRDVVEGFAPYAAVVAAAESARAPIPLTLEWIETYWAAHGMGSSESNRAEGAASFARIVEAAGYGRFRQGRRGHPSRIEWGDATHQGSTVPRARTASRTVRRAAPEPARSGDPRELVSAVPDPVSPPQMIQPPASADSDRESGTPDTAGDREEINRIDWELSPGRRLLLSVPRGLTPAEAQRIRDLLRLLIPG